MKWTTEVTLEKGLFLFSHADSILLVGSCFAEHIGNRLTDHAFLTDVNPFGTLYNPSSVAMALRRLMHPVPFTVADLFAAHGGYHSYAHHSRFSARTETECLQQIDRRLEGSSNHFRQATRLVVTFGTAFVYRLKRTGEVVANCHKQPDALFERERLTAEQIVADWRLLLSELQAWNPHLCVLFTVSPIRHWKDGAHGNQLSKATLLLAIDQLCREFPGQTAYFPAYELVMDELRDYRFYAADLLHPSEQAVDYIWQRFAENWFSAETQQLAKACQSVKQALAHRPFDPENELYRQFIVQTLLRIERIREKIPFFAMDEEKELRNKYGIYD